MVTRVRRGFLLIEAVVGTIVLGIALAASNVPGCQSTLDQVLRKIRDHRDSVLVDHSMEILTGGGGAESR